MRAKYITPSITIFNGEGGVDLDAMRRHFDFLIQGGVDGILLLGSIGEFFAIPLEEKKKLIKCAGEYIGGRTRLIVGTSSMIEAEIIELSRFAAENGADECIILPPYYFPLSEKRTEAYFSSLADKLSDIRLMLYNFPDRTGYGIPAEVVKRLVMKHKNIVGIKDTQATVEYTKELLKILKPDFPEFEVFAGFDNNFSLCTKAGGSGCIAGLSNIVPGLCSELSAAAHSGDTEHLSLLQGKIDSLMAIYDVGVPFVPYIKAAVSAVRGGICDDCSFPISSITPEERQKVREILSINGIL